MSYKGKKVVDIIKCFAVVFRSGRRECVAVVGCSCFGCDWGEGLFHLVSQQAQTPPKPKLQANTPNCLTTSNIKAEMYARTFGDLGGGGLQNPFRVRSAGVYKYIFLIIEFRTNFTQKTSNPFVYSNLESFI
jgi:hypothetical protein